MKQLFILLVALSALSFEVPKGWIKAGSKPADYDMGTAKGCGRNKQNAATIKSSSERVEGFGTLMQQFSPEQYKGKRIKLTGYVKAANVDDWAGLWVRVDGDEERRYLSFDNMNNRPIRGTQDWTKCEIVLDVPNEATNISFGALLSGTGQIWFDGLNFEVVPSSVQTTDMMNKLPLSKEPQNLAFDK